MTKEEQERFDIMTAEMGLTEDQKRKLEALISDATDTAYQRGADAADYSNAVNSQY